MPIPKKGVRVLGIAESYTGRHSDHIRSTLAGVVMRRDRVIDGIGFGSASVGGMDATDGVLDIFHALKRNDINYIMLSGCVVSWFNIVNPEKILEETGIPLITVTYENSSGLEDDISHHFPEDAERLEAYRRLGTRNEVRLHTGYSVFIRSWGIGKEDSSLLCNLFTLDGKIPEPIRVARLVARATAENFGIHGSNENNSLKFYKK